MSISYYVGFKTYVWLDENYKLKQTGIQIIIDYYVGSRPTHDFGLSLVNRSTCDLGLSLVSRQDICYNLV